MRRKDVSIQPPAPEELAYLAGVIDGEGHVMARRVKPGRVDFGLVLCMADIPILEWVHERFGGSYSGAWINEKTKSRPRKMWHLSRAADLAFLIPQLAPYLVLKRREAEIVALIARHSLDPKGFASGGRRGEGRTQEWRDHQDRLVSEFRIAFDARH